MNEIEQFLQTTFPERVISTRGTIEMSLRFPEFFFAFAVTSSNNFIGTNILIIDITPDTIAIT